MLGVCLDLEVTLDPFFSKQGGISNANLVR